jgi:copper chaperone NosL
MKNKLSTVTKLFLLVAAAGLVAVLFTPIWRIDLIAPQYPEGLYLTIHANGLEGNVDIINGLNHYIGMKTLHNADFIEFTILPYVIVFFAVLFAVTMLVSRRWLLNTVFILFVLFGILAMYDFWKWEYDYGHDLDPAAAIIVPGMAYQPPLIGFKQLLNFGAYSFPDTGGWIFIVAGVLLLIAVILEWRKNRSAKRYMVVSPAAVLLLAIVFSSCNTDPEIIQEGKDQCYSCKMTITDIKYAAEIVTTKGKVYKFDDVYCLLAFNKEKVVTDKQVKDIYLSDFTGEHTLIKAGESFLLQGGQIRGPMNGNIIASGNKDSLLKIATHFNAEETTWQRVAK